MEIRQRNRTGLHIYIRIIIFALFVLSSCYSARVSNYKYTFDDEGYQKQFEEYKRLNESESRLMRYKDSDDVLRMKIEQLSYINKSRKQYKVKPVKLDILASRVANKMAEEACDYEYTGHWNLRGEKPYHRYAFAGGYDHVEENAYGMWANFKFDSTGASVVKYMNEAHDSFMIETPPNDGHKKNIIDSTHNYVGIGVCLKAKQFRYYEEFVDRYIEFIDVKTKVKRNEKFSIKFKSADKGLYVNALVAYFEPVPDKLTPKQLNRKGTYNDFTNEKNVVLWPWDLYKYEDKGIFTVPMKFSKRGLYYIQIFLNNEPYDPITDNFATTEGKVPGSGIVIKVE